MKTPSAPNKIIIVLTQHPIFGALLFPYFYEEKPDGTLLLLEQAFHASKERLFLLNEVERSIINLASLYVEKELMNTFSKEKVLSKFLKNITESQLKEKIRPAIEKKLWKIVELICEYNIPLYQNQIGNKQLYHHNKVDVSPHITETTFRFEADEKNFKYSLQCYREGEPISLMEKKPVITISANPASVLLGMELHRFRDITASRILPFTNKREVVADVSLTDKYLENIVLPVIRYHEVISKGLPLIEEKRECEPVLSVSETVFEGLSFQLLFRYGDKEFRPGDPNYKYAFLNKETGKATIHYLYRDKEKEKSLINLLEESNLRFDGECNFYLNEEAPEKDLSEWIFSHKELLSSELHLRSAERDAEYCLDKIEISKELNETNDWFELHINVLIGNFRIPFIKFRKNILEGRKEYLLPDGRIILLPEEWFSKYADLIEFGKIDEKEIRIKRPYAGIVQSVMDQEESKTSYQPKENIPEPLGLKATLRNYQKDGFNWLMHLHKHNLGGCLADDMGLGKTLQTLALLQYLYEREEKRPATLIVMPTSLLHNWKREIKKFTTLRVYDYSTNHQPEKQLLQRTFDYYHLILTTYGMMRNNIDTLETYQFEYAILDESQNIKNSDSMTFKTAVRIRSNFRLVLTGTPIENSLKDLWSQFHFIQPELLGTESEFNKRYINPIKQEDKRAENKLQKLITPYILRRKKEEVAPELPALTTELILCEMSDKQKEIYLQEKNGLRNLLLKLSTAKEKSSNLTVLNGIMKLRQLASHPKMVLPDFPDGSGKLEAIISIFETLQSEGHKVLIFSSFVKHLELIGEAFQQRGWKYALLTGVTTNREEEIARFNKDSIQAFLISLKAGGVGLNLTVADYVFIIDPWWNPAAESQAISRAHRIGQEKNVFAYRFITEDSIEEKIIQLQESKRHLSETFITENNPLEKLTDEEWAVLLEE